MAYGRTFLQLVNDALRELREDVVTTWDATEYSKLIGQFVNSCRRDAEAAWRWTMLRDTFTLSTVQGTTTYAFTGTDERAQVLDGWNTTFGRELMPLHWSTMNAAYYGTTTAPAQGEVAFYTANGINPSTGEYQVDVYPPPIDAQTLKFTVYAPQSDFTADADVMLVPHRPVVEGAVARARFERGEDGGVSSSGQRDFMAQALGDHIALDAGNVQSDLAWVPV
jgi:hypothetical protein